MKNGKKLQWFSYDKNIANFEAFHWDKNLLFLSFMLQASVLGK